MRGEIQKPQTHHFGMLSVQINKIKLNEVGGLCVKLPVKYNILPLEMMYPPRPITTNMAKDPNVLATIIFRPKDPITRKSPKDI